MPPCTVWHKAAQFIPIYILIYHRYNAALRHLTQSGSIHTYIYTDISSSQCRLTPSDTRRLSLYLHIYTIIAMPPCGIWRKAAQFVLAYIQYLCLQPQYHWCLWWLFSLHIYVVILHHFWLKKCLLINVRSSKTAMALCSFYRAAMPLLYYYESGHYDWSMTMIFRTTPLSCAFTYSMSALQRLSWSDQAAPRMPITCARTFVLNVTFR